MNLSDGVSDDDLQQRLSLLAPNKACTLIYTVSSQRFTQYCSQFHIDQKGKGQL